MTSAPHFPTTAVTEQLAQPRRLRLRPKSLTTTGHVDGAWWPRSRDLVTELPALLAGLAVRLGHVMRVSYNLPEWSTAPRRAPADGGQVRLDGFNSRPAHTVDLVAADGHRLTLLVVPADTDQATAHHTMALAADRDNVQTVQDLLTAGSGPTTPTRQTTDLAHIALLGWEADGGRVPEQTSRRTS
ncbi:DUF5994 family protein [Saccharothrix sp. S26]|uniref:DUF5994 family protein n=1 Tax=Saccharothrix sp. S26 TaxID=2907215 RepID=UPI001F2AC796|nr:DUF5994 family protein [Saccharothrix sp. S26]MCE6996174.1 DUF5994 family protein [Saccharothrix sp. S26]